LGGTGTRPATSTCSAGTVGVAHTLALRGASTTCPAIQYRAGATNSATATTSLVVNVPAGVQDGDVMLAAISAGAGTIVKPAAWSNALVGTNQALYYRIASSEPTSWTAFNFALRPAVPTVQGTSTRALPTFNNWTCRFASDQMPAGQQRQAGTVQTDLYLDNAPPIAYRASAQNVAGGAANSILANKPAGTLASDVMIAHLGVRGGTGVTDASITVPAGWTRIDRIDNGTTLSLLVYWKTNAGAETSYSWSWSGTAQKAALNIAAYFGVHTT